MPMTPARMAATTSMLLWSTRSAQQTDRIDGTRATPRASLAHLAHGTADPSGKSPGLSLACGSHNWSG